jgi:hypothetical protein
MVARQSLLYLLIFLITAMAWRPGTAETLGPISEETPPAVCDPGSFVTAVKCTGDYCDNISISCARFSNATFGSASWTDWVSDEQGERRCWSPDYRFIAGFACRGRYCDNVSLYCVEVTNLSSVNCTQTGSVSEEGGGNLSFNGPWFDGHGPIFASGMTCSGSFCDNKSFRACEVSTR